MVKQFKITPEILQMLKSDDVEIQRVGLTLMGYTGGSYLHFSTLNNVLDGYNISVGRDWVALERKRTEYCNEYRIEELKCSVQKWKLTKVKYMNGSI